MPHDAESDAARHAPPARRPRRALLRLALVAGSALFALPLAELAYRAVSALRGRPYDARATEESLRAMSTAMNESMPRTDPKTGEEPYDGKALHPYLGVDSRSGLANGELFARRFQNGELDDAFTVVVLGGSVAAQSATTTGEFMQAVLARDARLSGRRVMVLSQARGGLKQPQQATLFAYLLAMGWDPDAVVNIDGFNEVALAGNNLATGVHPLHPDYPGWAVLAARRSDLTQEIRLAGRIVELAEDARSIADRALERGWTKSALLGALTLSRVGERRSRWSELQREYAALLAGGEQRNPAMGPRFTETGDEAERRIIDAWYQSSLNLHAMCSARGIAYLHVLQPTLHDTGSKTLTPEEIEKGVASDIWVNAVHEGYPRLREAGARLKEHGVAFADLSGVFRDLRETTYYDMCHFRGRGAELFVERAMQALLERLPAQVPRRVRGASAR